MNDNSIPCPFDEIRKAWALPHVRALSGNYALWEEAVRAALHPVNQQLVGKREEPVSIALPRKALAHYISAYCRLAGRTDLDEAETIVAALDALDKITTVPLVDAVNYDLALGETLAVIALDHIAPTGDHIPRAGS